MSDLIDYDRLAEAIAKKMPPDITESLTATIERVSREADDRWKWAEGQR